MPVWPATKPRHAAWQSRTASSPRCRHIPRPRRHWQYYARLNSGDYIKDGIRINAVAPGFVHTQLTSSSLDDPIVGDGMKAFLAGIPVGRGAQPEEIASLTAYLFGPESTFLVGSVLFADGGTDAALHGKDWPKMWAVGG
ncbi:SDR family oxidoreductase [Nocardia sp. NPDC050193]